MKFKLLQQTIVMAKYTLIGVYLQCLFAGLLLASSDIAAQKKSIEDVYITVNLKNTNLEEAFMVIGEKTNFNFQYNKKLASKRSLKGSFSEVSLGELLRFISQETSLSFKRINETIHVSKSRTNKASVAEIMDTQLLREDIQVTGKVTGDDGEGLPGVNVLVEGTTNGAITDLEGNYKLTAPDQGTLVFSFVGYNSKNIAIQGRAKINVQLAPDVTELSEIIVVGYGAQENRKVSVAASQINTEELEIDRRPVPNIQSALIGTVPGLIMEQSSGKLGQEVGIQVRSTSALQSKGALILIDGFEGTMSDLAPSAIASVTVLKDAAATAIYGARGANGVVLVTTKGTKRNENLSLSYSFNHSIQTPAQTAELANSLLFMEFSNEAVVNETLRNNPGTDPSTIGLPYSDEEIARAASGFYPETQWVDQLYSENAGQTAHNIGITGGSKNSGYFINMGLLDQNGLLAGSDNFKRYNLRVNIDTDITDWLTVGTNTSIVHTNLNNVPVSEGSSIRGKPFFPVKTADGIYVDKGAAGGEPNPVGQANSGSYDREKRDALNLQLYTKITPFKGLVLEERVSFVRTNSTRDIWNTPYEYVFLDMDLNQVGDPIQPVAADRNLELRSGRRYRINSLTTARYEKSFNENHNFNLLLGLQTTREERREQRAGKANFILDNIQDLSLGQEPLTLNVAGLYGLDSDDPLASEPSGITSRVWDNRTTLSYFSRLSYDFKGRYNAEFNFRADASSNFGKNNQWGYFPALSFAWNVSEEGFMTDMNFVDFLKIRTSWGQNGDDGNLDFIERAIFNTNGYALGGVIVPTINLGNSVNQDLKWETSEKINLGLDFSLWEGKLALNADYFIDKRSDIITQRLISLESGLAAGVLDNVYDAESWGWELEIGHKNNFGDLNVFANFNLSYYNSEITNTDGTSPLNPREEGYQDQGLPIFGNWFGYQTDGYFDNQAEMDAHVDDNGNPIDQSNVVSHGDGLGRYLGGFKYVDQLTVDTDNDGVPDAKDGIINADDRIILKKNAVDNYRMGFNFGAAYKGFSFSARLYGVLSAYEWWNNGDYLNPFTGDRASYIYQTDTWRPDNPNALFPQATATNIIPFERYVSDLIQTNAYVKLKNINLAYSFNQNVLDKLKFITSLQVYMSVENLGVLWTNSPSHDKGWDPELGTGDFRYPLPLTTSFGLNLKF
ncbi:MAG: TonB-dependent receptor [Cyclobacteriaceae bacterium]